MLCHCFYSTCVYNISDRYIYTLLGNGLFRLNLSTETLLMFISRPNIAITWSFANTNLLIPPSLPNRLAYVMVLLPFTFGCVSESSVAVGVQPPRRSKSDTIPSPIRPKEVGDEEEEEDSLSGESTKNSFRSLSLPKPNISTSGIHRLFKGFKNFSQIFVYKDDDMEEVMEMDMEIGGPTDVKHVTHIGWDGSASAASATTDPIRGWDNLISPDLLSVSPVSWSQFELSMPSQADVAVPLVNGSSS